MYEEIMELLKIQKEINTETFKNIYKINNTIKLLNITIANQQERIEKLETNKK